MTRNIITKSFGFILATALILSACSNNKTASIDPEESDENLVGMPNPSAVYCERLGYSMETVVRDGGSDADCIFPDGSRCGAWDFLSGRCGQEFTFCEKQGFTIEEGANIGTCRFSDNSFCDEFQYFSGECTPGDNPGVSIEDPIQILGFSEARDFIAAYFYDQYGIEQTEPWVEQNITPDGVVGSSTIRFVSGPLTIVISAPAAAPAPTEYGIEEASFIANGFYWEGTLGVNGDITESIVITPASILSEEHARDAIMEYIMATYNISDYGEWIDRGVSQTDADTALRVFISGSWVVEVEFIPAAPLVSSYHVTVNNSSEGIRWEGDISYHGDVVEINFSK